MSVIACGPDFTSDFGLGSECACCGGSATLGGTVEPIPGSAPILRYCSIECHDDWENFLAEQRERTKCCPSCGFDQQEHSADCPAGRGAAPVVRKEPEA